MNIGTISYRILPACAQNTLRLEARVMVAGEWFQTSVIVRDDLPMGILHEQLVHGLRHAVMNYAMPLPGKEAVRP